MKIINKRLGGQTVAVYSNHHSAVDLVSPIGKVLIDYAGMEEAVNCNTNHGYVDSMRGGKLSSEMFMIENYEVFLALVQANPGYAILHLARVLYEAGEEAKQFVFHFHKLGYALEVNEFDFPR